MHLTYLFAIITALADIVLACFVFLKNPRQKTNLFFSLFSLASGFWVLSTYSAIYTEYSLLFGRLSFSAVIAGITFLLFFVLAFPDEKYASTKNILLASLLPAIFILLSFTNLLVVKVTVVNHHLSGVFGQAYYSYRFFNMFYTLLILLILFQNYKKASTNNKLKIKYILLGLSLFLVPAVITNMVLPGFFNNRNYNNLGPLFSVFMVCYASYAIVKHQLMDINVIIQKSLIYSILLGLIVLSYLTIVFVFGEIFQKTTNLTTLLSAIITTAIGIFTVPWIIKSFEKLTDKFFYKNKLDHAQAINQLSETLNINIELQQLIQQTNQKLKELFKVKYVVTILWQTNAIYINNDQLIKSDLKPLKSLKELREIILFEDQNCCPKNNTTPNNHAKESRIVNLLAKHDLNLIIPIILHNDPVGLIILSNPLSGSPFSNDDQKLLKTFAYQAAVALEKARLFDNQKNYAQELEKRVARRTRKIRELQEEQKRMMLEISHELQTPLTIAKIGLEKIKHKKQMDHDMLSFEKSVDWISKFIYDLLKLARLEMADSFKFETVNVSELLADHVEYYETLTQNQGIILNHKIEPNIIIRADKAKLEELTNTLMSNAVKYIANKKRIDIYLKSLNQDIELTIKDTGVGIMAKNLPLIFKRYFMEKRLENKSVKGSGLGLAIAKKIVDGHNGAITVTSQENKGSVFTVTLPKKS